ncbi:MAG TPA: cobamide remodeling phosphodiesterase CbiR [Anaerolineae bacterium]|nr:cobamide remodeling phosphodiesterase CbiR [Anaerolineae bacterium]
MDVIKFGATTLPLVGWVADPLRPEQSRTQRLAAIRQLVQGYGLQAVELTLDLAAVHPQVFDATFYADVANLQQELAFVCTIHLPFLWVDPASLNEPIRQASAACLRQAIERTDALEIDTYVLHLWGFTTMQIAAQLQHLAQRQAILGGLMMQAGRSLEELCEILDPRDLCVENLEDSLFDLAPALIEQHGASICLDVGHLVWQGINELDVLERFGDRIREVHLHDAARPSAGQHAQIRDHMALGQGQVDYAAFLRKLDEMGYDGTVILELNSQADLETSLQRLAPFLQGQFN